MAERWRTGEATRLSSARRGTTLARTGDGRGEGAGVAGCVGGVGAGGAGEPEATSDPEDGAGDGVRRDSLAAISTNSGFPISA